MRTRCLWTIRAAWLTVCVAGVLAVAAPAGQAAEPAWTTYDHDAARSATDPDSTAPLTPSVAWSAQLDGAVWGQPLVDGSRVYVATENDTIYALDGATGAVVWQRSVGTAVPSADLPCGDISPTVGITSTPVIDPAAGRLYAVADVLAGGAAQHQLVALNLTDGSPVAGFPVAVDPPGQTPADVLQRGSLALDGGRVIVPYGGNDGDCGTYHGWLVSVAESGAGPQDTFEVEAGTGEHGGAIWGAGDGPSQDAAGDLFVSTGNGFGALDLQESVVELSPTLGVLAHWTPANWQTLDTSDQDLGSSEPLPLPGGLLFVAGKDGVGRLVSATALSGTGQVSSVQACSSGGVFGASLYHAGVIYAPCAGGLVALSLSGSRLSPVPGFSAPAGASGPPILAGGLVWSTGWRSTGLLYGLDPSTGAVRYSLSLGGFAHFATPSAGGGGLFVAAGSKLTALRVATFPAPTATAPLPPAAKPPASAKPAAPRLSHVSLSSRRFTARRGTTLRFTLSKAATLHVQVNRLRAGRRVAKRCRVGARHGRRCTVQQRARRFTFHARRGRRHHALRMRGLRAGRYVAKVSASAAGRRSRTVTLRFVIVAPRR